MEGARFSLAFVTKHYGRVKRHHNVRNVPETSLGEDRFARTYISLPTGVPHSLLTTILSHLVFLHTISEEAQKLGNGGFCLRSCQCCMVSLARAVTT